VTKRYSMYGLRCLPSFLIVSLVAVGCGGGGGGTTATAALKVVRTTPADGATDVAPTTAIAVEFDRALGPVTAASMEVRDSSGVVAGAPTAGGTTLTFAPAAPFAHGTTYTVTVWDSVQGSGGERLASAFIFSFSTSPVSSYSIGGDLSGLGASKSLVLQNNDGDELTLNADGAFTFATPVAPNAAYKVTILTQPSGQTCEVQGGTGNATHTITSVTIVCSDGIELSAAVSGLVGGTLVLTNNQSATALTSVTANGTVTFAGVFAPGAAYNVTVAIQPAGQNCIVMSGRGLAGATPVSVAVACTSVVGTYLVQGTAHGLHGAGLVLRNNDGDDMAISPAANVLYIFLTRVATGLPYAVTIAAQPSGQTCAVKNGAGLMGSANVTTVEINCSQPIGVTVSRLLGSGLVLQNNAGDDLSIDVGNGTYAFAAPVAWGDGYDVTIVADPSSPTQVCSVSGGNGTVGGTVMAYVSCNTAPVANAGPAQPSVAKRSTTTLDGTGSQDADGDSLSYAWSQTAGTTMTLSSATAAKPTFTSPGTSGPLTFALVVHDAFGGTSTASSVNLTVVNQIPTANAGSNQTVKPTTTVTLHGNTSSDADGDSLTYSWTPAGTNPAVVSLSSSTVTQPTFVAPATLGTYDFALTVNDGEASSSAANVTVTIANIAPTADAGAGDTFNGGETFALDATQSADADGDRLFFTWSQTSGTAKPDLDGRYSVTPVLAAPNATDSLTFAVAVDDTFAPAAATASVTHTILPWAGTRNVFSNAMMLGSVTMSGYVDFDVNAAATHLFIANGAAGVQIFALANPTSALYSLTDAAGSAVQVDVAGSYLYAVFGAGTAAKFLIYDVSNLASSPVLMNAGGLALGLAAGEYVSDIKVAGSTAWVAVGAVGLKVIDVSAPATPSSTPIGAGAGGAFYGLEVTGGRVYIRASTGLWIIDEASLAVLGSGYAAANLSSLAASGNTVYLGLGDHTVAVLNATDPAAITLATTLGTASSVGENYVAVGGTRLYAARGPGLGVEVYDISTPLAPSLVGKFNEAVLSGLLPIGNTLFLKQSPAVTWFDATGVPLAARSLPGTFALSGAPTGMAVMGDGLLLVVRSHALDVIDISNPLAPVALRTAYQHDANAWYYDVAVMGRYAVLSDGIVGLDILDLRDPVAPTLVTEFNIGASAGPILISGSTVYTTHAGLGLKITSLADPTAPAAVGTYTAAGGSQYRYLARSGNTLAVSYYVSPTGYYVDLVDVTDPSAPLKRSSIFNPIPLTAIAAGNNLLAYSYAFISGPIRIYDISNPAAPTQVGSTAIGTPSYAMHMAGNQLIMAVDAQTAIYDLATPATPVRQGLLPGDAQVLAVAGDTVVLGLGQSNGLRLGAWQPALAQRYTTTAPAADLIYDLSWQDASPAGDVGVRCRVTGGTCAVTSVNQTTNSATVTWTAPATTGDHELVVSVGDASVYTSAMDRVTVQ